VLLNGNNYLVTVSTNSTITNFKFDSSRNTESYEVEGVNNTVGYCNVTIPKSLLTGGFIVQVDGVTTYYSLNQNATDSFLYFTYKNADPLVEISGQAIPEFATWAYYGAVFICTTTVLTAVLMLVKRKRRITTKEDHTTQRERVP
jgi:hypothetical protein